MWVKEQRRARLTLLSRRETVGNRGKERPAPPPALSLRRGGALMPPPPPERGLDPPVGGTRNNPRHRDTFPQARERANALLPVSGRWDSRPQPRGETL